jgi:hypothetical protein
VLVAEVPADGRHVVAGRLAALLQRIWLLVSAVSTTGTAVTVGGESGS